MRTAFLSSTSNDLKVQRESVFAAFQQLEHWRCYRMEEFTPTPGVSTLDYCRQKASEVDLFIGLIGHCYGSIPPGEQLSYTELEYIAASSSSRLIYLANEDFPVPASVLLSESADQREKQRKFRDKVRHGPDMPAAPVRFESPEKLANAVMTAVNNWEQQHVERRNTSTNSLGVRISPSEFVDSMVFKDVDESWCPPLVVLPTGTFLMGSPPDDPDAYPEEKPQHSVQIKHHLAIGKFPITFEEYDFFCEATSRQKPSDEGWRRGRHPVINVGWHDAREYVQWLSGVTKQPYRLPSEAEWEYACRSGTTSRFYRGNHLSIKHANYDMASGRTTEVGSYPSNRWGLYDMLGNIWEHVQDTYHDSYVNAPSDGSAWIDGGDLERRVVRGGSYSYTARDNRSAVRCDHDIYTPDRQHGFRVARSL